MANMLQRCRSWDYTRPCIYQITLVLADRASKALGEVVVDEWDERRLPTKAHCEESALGRAVFAHWRRIGEFTPEIKPIKCRIMPDHLHAILQVTRPLKRPLGNAIGGFKTGCEKIFRELALAKQNRQMGGLEPERQMAGLAPERQIAGLAPEQQMAGLAPERHSRQQAQGSGCVCAQPIEPSRGAGSVSAAQAVENRLFAPGFQDTILFREGQLQRMLDYLDSNPLRLAIKRACPDLFRIVCDLVVPLGEGLVGHFAALGNRFLLDRPLAHVQVSRRLFAYMRVAKPGGGQKIARSPDGEPLIAAETAAYRERRDALFAAAKHGAVLLSPCVSDGERQIAREALAAKLPLIAMQNKGFSRLQKPAGSYFDACTEGRLLLLAPAAWPYTPGEKPITRFDATAMNRLCQLIAGEDAAEIDYHGMKPTNIDELAYAAAKAERRTD